MKPLVLWRAARLSLAQSPRRSLEQNRPQRRVRRSPTKALMGGCIEEMVRPSLPKKFYEERIFRARSAAE